MIPHLIFLIFLFALGACVGSFLNVVVWRLPRDESLISPPSHCPICGHKLAWYDNIPVFGWFALRGRCRYCFNTISAEYPAIEFLTGLIFIFYYVMFFIAQQGPCTDRVGPRFLFIQQDWPIYFVYMILAAALLAASLIDLRLFIIPLEIPWLLAIVGAAYHTVRALLPGWPAAGSLYLDPNGAAAPMTLGAGVGLLIALALLLSGKLSRSFPDGEPLLEVDKMDEEELTRPSKLGQLFGYLIERFRRPLSEEQRAIMEKCHHEFEERESKLVEAAQASMAETAAGQEFTKNQIRAEMRHEMLFLLIPLCCALLTFVIVRRVPAGAHVWSALSASKLVQGFLGALFGSLIGGFVVWITRILGTLVFGRVAMGLGDVHLMFGVGAILGAGAATVAFFIAPFFGILVAVWMLLTGTRRELPYGPYLSLATAFVMLFYCPIADYLTPGLLGLIGFVQSLLGY